MKWPKKEDFAVLVKSINAISKSHFGHEVYNMPLSFTEHDGTMRYFLAGWCLECGSFVTGIQLDKDDYELLHSTYEGKDTHTYMDAGP